MAGLSDKAKWISADPATYGSNALPVFRRSVRIERPIAHAVVRLCGLGHHELQVNGIQASDDVLEPAWTNYAKTCLYVMHEVTSMLRAGENELRVMLGNGMYNVTGGRYVKFKGSYGQLQLILELRVEFADGTSTTIVSDESWQVAPGPITFSCIYGGEDYDARLELAPPPLPSPGVPGEGVWPPVALASAPGWHVAPQQSPPLRVMRTFRPTRREHNVYDFGQNFSGWVQIKVKGSAGEKITLKTAELLDDQGLPTQRHIGSPVSFSYTCKGGGEVETWRPRFSYHGFRYAQVEGLEPIELEGQFVHSSARVVGGFRCSNELLNRIHDLIDMAVRSNMQHVLTDCPHREKLGWLEQSHLMAPAILFRFDAASLYAKMCADMRDAQHADGCVPTIAPQYTIFQKPWDVFNDSPEWGSAAVLNPWAVFQHTGDRGIIGENYEAMKRYVQYLDGRANDGIVSYGLGDWYDIGPGEPGISKLTTLGLTATAIYFADVVTMCRFAGLLGRADDEDAFRSKVAIIRAAFNGKFLDPRTNQYDRGSQCANAMALALGLAEPSRRSAVLENLVSDIRAHNNHITAGDIGFRYVIEALANAGRSDVIFDILSRTDSPSYGYQLAQGATTLTEAWDANPRHSQNHLMLGHAQLWFYRHLGGIQVDLSLNAPRQIMIRPAVVGDVTWAEASYESKLGRVGSRWERSGRKVKLAMTLPIRAVVQTPDGVWREAGAGEHLFECEVA